MISNTKNIKIKRIIRNFKLVKDNHSRKDIVRINPIKNFKKNSLEKKIKDMKLTAMIIAVITLV